MRKAALAVAILVTIFSLCGCSTGNSGKMSWTGDCRDKLFAVSTTGGGEAWSVGAAGVILHYAGPGSSTSQDAGAWNLQQSGTTIDLKGISALDPSHVWAVGGNGTILFYNGHQWLRQDSGTDVELCGVCALNTSHVWACGWGETILFFDGTRWARQRSGEAVLRGITAADANSVWAVGSNGVILHFDGSRWAGQDSGTDSELTSVSAVNRGDAWACGLNGTVLRFSGEWHEQRSGDEMLRGISVAGKNDVWVVGYLTQALATTPGSVVLRFDGRWQEQAVDPRLYPTGVSAQKAIWVAGLGGVARGEPR